MDTREIIEPPLIPLMVGEEKILIADEIILAEKKLIEGLLNSGIRFLTLQHVDNQILAELDRILTGNTTLFSVETLTVNIDQNIWKSIQNKIILNDKRYQASQKLLQGFSKTMMGGGQLKG